MNLFITWNVSPEIINIFGLSIRWYSLLFASAFIAGYYILKIYLKNIDNSTKMADSALIYTIIGTIVGARLGHCFFYEPEYYLANPLEVFKTWNGGLASHGAAIGILLSIWIFARKNKVGYIWSLDRIAPVIALSGLFIRLGNLMNSEIYGKPTNLPWAFKFVRDETSAIPRHPTQIYEALIYLASFLILHKIFRKYEKNLPNGVLISVFLILIFGTRFFVEFLKERQVEFENAMALDMGQWLSIPFTLIGIVSLIYIYKKNKGFKKTI